MKTWQKILATTCVTLLVGGLYLLAVWQHRRNPGVVPPDQQAQKLNPDDVAVVRMLFMQHYSDTSQLVGTSVWMKNGYTMPYYPYNGQVVFKRVGLIAADQKLDIVKIVKAAVPARVDDSMSHGSRQVFAVFTLPGGKKQYATPFGVIDGNREEYFSDLLFYYDNPHKIYDNWPANVWAAIDAHQAKPGMNELQVRTALGQNIQAHGGAVGNRTLTYNVDGSKWTVTFVHDRATTVKPG